MKTTQIKIGMDTNGNKVAKFQSVTGKRGFSIQTNGNLPNLQRMHVGDSIDAHQRVDCWKEFLAYVNEFGTDRQKTFFNFNK